MSRMNNDDTRRIVSARALMWDAASGDEQAKWLRIADDASASLERAASRPAQPVSDEEGQAHPPLRAAQ